MITDWSMGMQVEGLCLFLSPQSAPSPQYEETMAWLGGERRALYI